MMMQARVGAFVDGFCFNLQAISVMEWRLVTVLCTKPFVVIPATPLPSTDDQRNRHKHHTRCAIWILSDAPVHLRRNRSFLRQGAWITLSGLDAPPSFRVKCTGLISPPIDV